MAHRDGALIEASTGWTTAKRELWPFEERTESEAVVRVVEILAGEIDRPPEVVRGQGLSIDKIFVENWKVRIRQMHDVLLESARKWIAMLGFDTELR